MNATLDTAEQMVAGSNDEPCRPASPQLNSGAVTSMKFSSFVTKLPLHKATLVNSMAHNAHSTPQRWHASKARHRLFQGTDKKRPSAHSQPFNSICRSWHQCWRGQMNFTSCSSVVPDVQELTITLLSPSGCLSSRNPNMPNEQVKEVTLHK